jgi:hypothetical protein
VFAASRTIDVDDRVIRSFASARVDGYGFLRHLFARPGANGSVMLVRRDVATDAGGYDATWAKMGIGGVEDLDFELKVSSRFPICVLPLYLIGYRVYAGNMSSRYDSMARCLVAVIDKHVAEHPEIPPWVAREMRAAARNGAMWMLLAGKGKHLGLSLRFYAEFLGIHPRAAIWWLKQIGLYVARRPAILFVNRHKGASGNPSFADCEPEQEVETQSFDRATENMFRRLEPLDAEMGARVEALRRQRQARPEHSDLRAAACVGGTSLGGRWP